MHRLPFKAAGSKKTKIVAGVRKNMLLMLSDHRGVNICCVHGSVVRTFRLNFIISYLGAGWPETSVTETKVAPLSRSNVFLKCGPISSIAGSNLLAEVWHERLLFSKFLLLLPPSIFPCMTWENAVSKSWRWGQMQPLFRGHRIARLIDDRF